MSSSIKYSCFFVFILFVCGFLSSNAQTIYWITFIDTSDWQLGDDNMNAKRALENRFIAKVNAALEWKGYNSKIYSFIGNDVTASMCGNVVNNISCGEKDIVVFYYIGHGGRPQTTGNLTTSPWPEMEFVGNSKKYMSLDVVHQRLKKKKPRLTLTIGMCCNIAKPSHKRADGLSSQSRYSKIVSKNFAKRIQKWFASYAGDIQVAAASADELAYGGFKCVEGEMDYFTGTLCMLMDNYASSVKNEDITWPRFLKDLTYWTHYHVKQEQNEEQTPYYRINVVPIR